MTDAADILGLLAKLNRTIDAQQQQIEVLETKINELLNSPPTVKQPDGET